MHRATLPLALALAGCTAASAADRSDWQADFDAMVGHMDSAYANLEWIASARGLDLAALTTDTRTRLGAASSRRAARKIVESFIDALQDPHFHLNDGNDLAGTSAGGDADPGLPATTTADDALDAMHFKRRNLGFKVGLDGLPGFTTVTPSAENPFAWGILPVGPKRVGILRIAHFGEDGYPQIAAARWPAFAATLTGPCNDDCQWRFRTGVMNALLGYLAEGARALRDKGIDAMLIDISDNGGGTDWAAVAPRIFAPPLRKCPPLGVVRHPHHTRLLESQRDQLTHMLEAPDLSGESRATLTAARDSMAAFAARTRQPCDRSALFRTPGATLDCTQLAYGPACGAVEYLQPGSLADVPQRADVFMPLGQEFEEGIWTGPLFVLMNHNTASASEHFVSLLQANHAATFLGERTMGAGCGFIAGGIPLYLEHLDATVWMSDCARFRADGKNELEGFEPDLPIDWSGGNGARAERVRAALEKGMGGG